jgi:phospholipid/cholesterol/gamma-HCH transport system substrate-binding protein
MSAVGAKTRRPGKGGRRRQPRRLHPLVIAAIVIFGALFITYYAFNSGLPFVHRYTLYAMVNNSVNVRSDSPVRIAGIDVGKVDRVSPAGNATKISFTVSGNGLPIRKDATIKIRDRLFLEGGYYLQLDPGSPSAPALHDGDTIPESQTETPVQFYNVLSTFDVAARTSLKHLIDTLNHGLSPQPGQPNSSSGAGGLKTAVPELQPTLKDTAWITRALHGTRPGDLENLLSSASSVTSTLARNEGQLVQMVSALNRTSSALAASDGSLGQSISGLDQTLRVAPGTLSAVDHALPPLVNLAQALDPSLRVAPPIIDKLISTVRELSAVVAPMERAGLLTALKATFQEFPSILTQLATAFPISKQITDCLQTHVVPILNSQVPDGPLSTGRPVWQDFVHFLPNIAGASGNFDANGHYTRVLAAAGTNSLTGGILANLPIVGQLVGTAPPGGSSLAGARPSWLGDLKPSDFRPDAPCAAQPVPSLQAPTASSDLRSTHSPPPSAGTVAKARQELRRLTGAPALSSGRSKR